MSLLRQIQIAQLKAEEFTSQHNDIGYIGSQMIVSWCNSYMLTVSVFHCESGTS